MVYEKAKLFWKANNNSKEIFCIPYNDNVEYYTFLKKETVSIDFKPYQGAFEQEEKDSIIAKLYLLVYLEILPIIDQEYQSNLADKIWNKEAYINFMNKVGKNLTEKIDIKIKSLNE